ncbi:hypothetical protein ACN47E_005674 [Coniothyrium glycines]
MANPEAPRSVRSEDVAHAQTTYTYPPLSDGTYFRLLQLEPGAGSEPLTVSIEASLLHTDCVYDALSYVWGSPELVEKIWVGSKSTQVTRSLFTILRHLRSADKTQCLWVDALCIDQANDDEKSKQVAMMGQIFKHAKTVLCWFGELSMQRLWALKYLERLAEAAESYIDLSVEHIPFIWSCVPDRKREGVDFRPLLEDAKAAHVEAVYQHEWFTRTWIVQEITLAKHPRILCGDYEMGWDKFELATRILGVATDTYRFEINLRGAFQLLSLRGRYHIHNRPEDALPKIIEPSQPWSAGRIAWEMRDRQCKDDIDRVYAFASLAAATKATWESHYQRGYMQSPFMVDYSRSVEWAYSSFWKSLGGPLSLFHAGLSYRETHSENISDQVLKKDYLPSWAPELRRRHQSGWFPIFSFDYSASTVLQYRAEPNERYGTNTLTLRGHRFDTIVQTIESRQKFTERELFRDFVRLRRTIKQILSLEQIYGTYPNDEPWSQAVASTLLGDMPEQSDHTLQVLLDKLSVYTRVTAEKLKEMWQLYDKQILSDTGEVWRKCLSLMNDHTAVRGFRPHIDLPPDGRMAWLVHTFLRVAMEKHVVFITKRGYLGLGPPQTRTGDVVLTIGGSGTPFVARDVPEAMLNKLAMDQQAENGKIDEVRDPVSQLLGPAYLHGIMNGENLPIRFVEVPRHKEQFDSFRWDNDGTVCIVPKTTLTLI